MMITGIAVIIFGSVKHTQNAWLWATFPIAHGIHELLEFFILTFQLPFFWERVELSMAVLSAAALLAAVIEYNNTISSPIGKLTGLGTFITATYFIFTLTENGIEHDGTPMFMIGSIIAEPFRFFFGTFVILLAIVFLIISIVKTHYQEKRTKKRENIKYLWTSIIMVIVLLIFALVEGFDSTNSIFVSFRGITLSFFILIPIFVVLTSETGLQNLIILDESGVLLYQYDFIKKTVSLSNDVILSAGFLAAITSYSKEVLHGDNSFTLRSKQYYFSLIKSQGRIFTIQTRIYNRSLEKNFILLPKMIQKSLESLTQSKIEENTELNQRIAAHFEHFT